MSSLTLVVAGLGSRYRGDDAIGPLVADLCASAIQGVRDIGPLEEPLDLLGRFDGADLAIVIDAVRSGAPIGSVRVLDIDVSSSDECGDDAQPAATSTHGIGLVGVLRLARAIGRAPRRLMVVAIEGAMFALGDEMSVEVTAAVPAALAAVVTLIEKEQLCV